jgi:hypothetical protein
MDSIDSSPLAATVLLSRVTDRRQLLCAGFCMKRGTMAASIAQGRGSIIGRRLGRTCAGLGLAFLLSIAAAAPQAAPAGVDAASCVRIVGGVFDSPGNDNYMPYLNQEYVIVKNACSTSKLMTGWKVHDYNRIHVYRFPTGYRIAAGASVKLRSGTGTNSSTNLYWKRTYGAVWNNDPPERAYLRKSDGTLANSWSSY